MKFFKKLRDWFAGLFKPKPSDEKLYKFVYRQPGYDYTRNDLTLLVVASNPVEATKELYRLAKNNVKDIREFTEIKCSMTGTESVEVRDEG